MSMRAEYLAAYARRVRAQAAVQTGKMVPVARVEDALALLAIVVRKAPDTTAGGAKKGRDPGRHNLVAIAQRVYQLMQLADWIIDDARRELGRAQQDAQRDA